MKGCTESLGKRGARRERAEGRGEKGVGGSGHRAQGRTDPWTPGPFDFSSLTSLAPLPLLPAFWRTPHSPTCDSPVPPRPLPIPVPVSRAPLGPRAPRPYDSPRGFKSWQTLRFYPARERPRLTGSFQTVFDSSQRAQPEASWGGGVGAGRPTLRVDLPTSRTPSPHPVKGRSRLLGVDEREQGPFLPPEAVG